MIEMQLLRYLLAVLDRRLGLARLAPDRGDVAEKIVIVGVFVVLAVAVGGLVAAAVTHDAARISRQIGNAP